MKNGFKPPTLLLCGPSGIGKSSSIIRALNPKSTFWICTERGALLPAKNLEINPSGETPDFTEVLDYSSAYEKTTEAVRKVLDGYAKGQYNAVVLDTLSSLADMEYTRIRAIEGTRREFGDANKELALRLNQILWQMLDSKLLVVCIAHEKDPTTFNGKTTPGGPKLPGDLVKSVPSMFDLVLRCDLAADNKGNPKRVIRHNPLALKQFQTKDRFGVVKDGEDLDIKSILTKAVEAIN